MLMSQYYDDAHGHILLRLNVMLMNQHCRPYTASPTVMQLTDEEQQAL